MKTWHAVIAGAVAIALYTWWIYGLGADSVEAKVITVTAKEDARQSGDVGNLKAAEAKHEPKIIERIKIVREAADPSGCRDMPMPPDIVNALRVRDQIRGSTAIH